MSDFPTTANTFRAPSHTGGKTDARAPAGATRACQCQEWSVPNSVVMKAQPKVPVIIASALIREPLLASRLWRRPSSKITRSGLNLDGGGDDERCASASRVSECATTIAFSDFLFSFFPQVSDALRRTSKECSAASPLSCMHIRGTEERL